MVCSFVTMLLVLFFVIVRGFWDGFLQPGNKILMPCIFVLGSAPFIMKHTGSIAIAGFYLMLGTTLTLIIYSYYDGGFRSTSIPWFPVLPLFSVFFSGARYGLFIACILTVDLLFLTYAHHIGMVPSVRLQDEQLFMLYSVSTIAVMILLLVLAFLYLTWQSGIQAQLLKASEAKSEFLSGVSHELRSPLTAILGFSEVLSHNYVGELNKEQAEYVEFIHSSGNHLLSLVNDLLDIAKIESGQMELDKEPVLIPALITEVIKMHADLADAKAIQIKCFAQPDFNDNSLDNISAENNSAKSNSSEPQSFKHNTSEQLTCESDSPLNTDIGHQWVLVDKRKFKQVLINLISNAIKFTPAEGKVSISTNLHSQHMYIDILDNGPGISTEHHEAVFERFYQVNRSNDNKDPGTGLGLALSRFFVEMHNGTLTVEHGPNGQGARFIIQLPHIAVPNSTNTHPAPCLSNQQLATRP